MNQEELKTIVAQLLRQMQTTPEPTVKASEYHPTVSGAEDGTLPDIAALDLRQQYLVEQPAKGPAFLELKQKTPARLGLGRAGTRYTTAAYLRLRADHAAAQDSVFSLLPEDFARQHNLVDLVTQCRDKDEYLTRPDLGRRFPEAGQKVIEKICQGHKVVIVVGDGLSSAAAQACGIPCMQAITESLRQKGIDFAPPLFVRFCRVGAGDHIGDLTGCEVVCVLVGERPGLVTAESLSAYVTYRPRRGIPESKRTVVSNIHRQGIPPAQAGSQIAGLIATMLEKKASGLDLGRSE